METYTAAEKITKAKISLVSSEPFFATLAMRLNYIENRNLECTSRTDGKKFEYNPAAIKKMSLDEVKGMLCKQVLTIANLHHTRRGERDLKQWNISSSYAINPIVKEAGFKLPEGSLIDENFEGMGAEEIYGMIGKEQEDENGKDTKPGDGDGNQGPPGSDPNQIGDAPADTKEELQQIEAETKQAVIQAAMIAKKAGNLPANIERLIEQILQPVINWREVLSRFIMETDKSDYTFLKPNPRYLSTGFYMPLLENKTIGEIILIVDTSGSINEKLLNEFAAEMQEITNTFGKGFQVIYVDAEVQHTEEIEPDQTPIKLNAKGGGGTDFRPGFEFIDEQGLQPNAVIYFTDGYCSDFPAIPDFPVLWALWADNQRFDPPFGEVVTVSE